MISVIFSTYNGESTLSDTLDAMVALKYRENWKLLVVNNGSTDSTTRILASYVDRLPLTILDEPRRGKNKALNRAVECADGDFFVFTDDVIPRSDWLDQWSACSRQFPGFAVFGGSILPWWRGTPAPIVLRNAPLGMTYALTPPSIEEGPVNPRSIWGPNMAVRKLVFDEGHRFNEQVGPSSGQYMMGSETEFSTRVSAIGHRSCFYPAAQVRHIIRKHQLSRRWVVQRAFRYGRGKFREGKDTGVSVSCIFGIPIWRMGEIFRRILAYVVASILQHKERAFIESYELCLSMGIIGQWIRDAFRDRTPP